MQAAAEPAAPGPEPATTDVPAAASRKMVQVDQLWLDEALKDRMHYRDRVLELSQKNTDLQRQLTEATLKMSRMSREMMQAKLESWKTQADAADTKLGMTPLQRAAADGDDTGKGAPPPESDDGDASGEDIQAWKQFARQKAEEALRAKSLAIERAQEIQGARQELREAHVNLRTANGDILRLTSQLKQQQPPFWSLVVAFALGAGTTLLWTWGK